MHVFWIIRFTPTSKRPIRVARSSGMVVHPLAAWRSPTDDFFSLSLKAFNGRTAFRPFPQGGGGGYKKIPLEMDIPIRSSGSSFHRIGSAFDRCKGTTFFPIVGIHFPYFSFLGSGDPSLDKLA